MLSQSRVEGVSLEKDFENLLQLTKIIQAEELKRSEDIPIDKYDKTDPNQVRQAIEERKDPSDKLIQAVDYTRKLLNDINIAINLNGKGETYGLTFQLDGQKVNELEAFINAFEKELLQE